MWSKIEAKHSKYTVRIKLSEEINDDEVKVFLGLLIALVTDISIYAVGSPLEYFVDDAFHRASGCNISFHRKLRTGYNQVLA